MTNVEIYYFTGTGNSLFVAKDIAKRLNGSLIPIPSQMNHQTINPEAESIVLVFPVYNMMNDGIPLIVNEFVKKLRNIDTKYIVAIATSSGGVAPQNETLSRNISLQGGKLSAFYTIKMPTNVSKIPSKEKQIKIFQKWKEQVDPICDVIVQKKEIPYGFPQVVKILTAPLGAGMRAIFLSKMRKQCNSPEAKTFYELTPLMDKSYSVDEKCDGCGLCSRVCPVKNIEIVHSKPSWQHHCETCLACFHWCPKGAIQCPYTKERYHHPEVGISDMYNLSTK